MTVAAVVSAIAAAADGDERDIMYLLLRWHIFEQQCSMLAIQSVSLALVYCYTELMRCKTRSSLGDNYKEKCWSFPQIVPGVWKSADSPHPQTV